MLIRIPLEIISINCVHQIFFFCDCVWWKWTESQFKKKKHYEIILWSILDASNDFMTFFFFYRCDRLRKAMLFELWSITLPKWSPSNARHFLRCDLAGHGKLTLAVELVKILPTYMPEIRAYIVHDDLELVDSFSIYLFAIWILFWEHFWLKSNWM